MADRLRTMKDRASRLYADGKLREALAQYRRIVEDDPRQLACRVKVGDIHRRLGDAGAAVEAYFAVARRYADDGLVLKAIALCKTILGLDGSHAATQGLLADLYARKRAGTVEVPAVPVCGGGPRPTASAATDAPGLDALVLSAWPSLALEGAPPVELGPELGTPADPPALDEPLELATPDIPLFSELPKKAFVELMTRMRMLELRRGDVVLREGDDGDAFYVVASGIVSVSRKGPNGRDVRLAHLGEGAFFGEMAILQDGVRTATVRVEEDAQLFEISRELLEEVITRYPTVATALRNFYRQRLLASALATHPLFAAFRPDERRAVMEQFKSRSFAPGEVILEEGKKGTGLFLLLHGKVEVWRKQGHDRLVLAELGSGDLFGEMSLLTGEPTNATVVAADEAFVLRLSKKCFDELVLPNGALLDVVGSLSERRAQENRELFAHQLGARGAVLV